MFEISISAVSFQIAFSSAEKPSNIKISGDLINVGQFGSPELIKLKLTLWKLTHFIFGKAGATFPALPLVIQYFLSFSSTLNKETEKSEK